jgi:release factor glutamine methyltransferase
MSSRAKRVFFGDFAFFADENVYEPAEDSFLFAENLDVKEGERVLDMGTGCGILGIVAAKKASEVVAIDLNPYAVCWARENAALNGVRSKMAFVRSDLFASLCRKAKFDVILFNAPYLPANECEVESWIGRAWTGGVTGRETIDRFIPEASRHLKPTGQIFLMQSTLANVDITLTRFEEYGLKANVVTDAALPFFETITLLKAEKYETRDAFRSAPIKRMFSNGWNLM